MSISARMLDSADTSYDNSGLNYHPTIKVEPLSEYFTTIDDKHVPLMRIVWISDIPHFCGNEDCQVEGRYEIRVEGDESLFSTRDERDQALEDFERWMEGQ